MHSRDLGAVRTATEQQIRDMLDIDRNSQYSSFRLGNIHNLSSLMLCDGNDRLLAYAGHQSLDWDSNILALRSARIGYLWSLGDYRVQRRRLSRLVKASIDQDRDEQVEFMSTRIPCEDIASVHALEDNGFRLIESYLTFVSCSSAKADGPRPDDRVRPAGPADAGGVSQLAFEAFRYNRYMIDPLLPKKQARHSRLVWVQNAFKGRAEAVYLAEVDKVIAGFLIMRPIEGDNDRKIGLIDLIAVDSRFRGQGIGSSLVSQALRHYQGKVDLVEVGTQASNVAAVNLYQKMGFRFLRSEYSLHWHAELE